MLQQLIEQLQKAQSCIKEYDQIKIELAAVIEARDLGRERIKLLEAELKQWEESEDYEADDLISINLGLDTLHYRLEHGNLLIQQRLESFIRSANTIPNAEPAML